MGCYITGTPHKYFSRVEVRKIDMNGICIMYKEEERLMQDFGGENYEGKRKLARPKHRWKE